MIGEYTREELKKGIRKPYFHLLCKKVEVVVRNEDYEVFAKLAEQNNEPLEALLKRCLEYCAKICREDD